MFAPITLGVTS